MTQEPPQQSSPQLPQASRKRILPAFLLCFTVGAHRLYAGKIVSGIVQMAWVAGAFIWVNASLKDLLKSLNTGPQDFMSVMEHVGDWEEIHGGMPVLPTLALIGVGIWIAIDAAQLLRGKFIDGRGHRITRWI